ncbi:MAG: helix-turn-helix domain-containing protein [Lachnospiraceae bacterium]
MNTLHAEIGQRIASLRRKHNITQSQLAEKLDISVKHCSEVERGLSCLSLEKLVALCHILSTDMDYLVRGKDKRTSAESNVPPIVVELFDTADNSKKELLQEYILLFKKISDSANK